MAVFKSQSNTSKQRAKDDVDRHRELIKDSIKKGIGDIISEESIIDQSAKKKVKIPIRGLKEYRFVHGESNPGVGSGDGKQKKGDVIGKEEEQKGSGNGKAGNDEGDDYYEAEVTIEELITYLLDDLELPDIDKKKVADILSESYKRKGYQQKGIPPRLAKKKSMIEKIKRQNKAIKCAKEMGEEIDEDFRIPFHTDDLKYHHLRKTQKKQHNAVVMCIMDTSGSMDKEKKYMARSFYFLLYHFIRMKYENVKVVFVAHTTVGKEVNEDEFFNKGESGGTYISSGYSKALEIIEERFNPENWNIYAFHCSDGDNWTDDDERMIEYTNKLADISNLFGYCEIGGQSFWGNTVAGNSDTMKKIKAIQRNNIVTVTIKDKTDVPRSIKQILEKESD